MQEEWAVSIVSVMPLGDEYRPHHAVAIGEVSQVDGQPLAICEDEAEAARIAEVVAKQFGLPLYDGADPYPAPVNASTYVDTEADGPDPYSEHRNAAQHQPA